MNSARLRVVQPRGSQQPARRSTRTVYFTSSEAFAAHADDEDVFDFIDMPGHIVPEPHALLAPDTSVTAVQVAPRVPAASTHGQWNSPEPETADPKVKRFQIPRRLA